MNENLQKINERNSSPGCNGNPAATTKEERGIAVENGTELKKMRKQCCS